MPTQKIDFDEVLYFNFDKNRSDLINKLIYPLISLVDSKTQVNWNESQPL